MAKTPSRQILEQLNRLVRQPERDQLTQREDGALIAAVSYVCAWSRLLQLMPRRNVSKHPDFSDLVCRSVNASKGKPGVAQVVATYTGVNGPSITSGSQGQFAEVTEMVTNLRTEPIETHPDFTSTLGGTPASPKNGAIFNGDGIFTGFDGDSDYAGQTDYLTPGSTYRRTYFSRTVPQDSEFSVGSVEEPPGNPPTPSGASYNWLSAGISWRLDGGLYVVTAEYILSGPNGWNSNIYS